MDERLKEMIDHTAEKLGLEDYYFKRHHIFREKNHFNETTYLLCMEWFPNENSQTDNDLNPPGTALVDIDFHTQAVKRIVFVNDTSYANDDIFPAPDKESVIDWIESMTGLDYGKQFKLAEEQDGALRFHASIDNIPVSPSGTIKIEFNDANQLILFSIDGVFPTEDRVLWEPFSLTPETVASVAKDQFTRADIPLQEEEKWLTIYGLEEVYVTNNGMHTIPFEGLDQGSKVEINQVMEWDETVYETFSSEEIDVVLEVTLEQALANESHPETFPITEPEQERCIKETRYFLQREFPNDTGKWMLKGLHRENNFIFAILMPTETESTLIPRKIKLVIDGENDKAISYRDNNVLLDMFTDFQAPDKQIISQEMAYQQISKHIEVTPVYVYDPVKEVYILCGKVDCDYAVNAASGELVSLDEL